MNKRTFFASAVVFSFLTPVTASAQLSDRRDGMRFVPDVPGQFQALSDRADALGLHITTTPDPSMCKHYQAITRVDGAEGANVATLIALLEQVAAALDAT